MSNRAADFITSPKLTNPRRNKILLLGLSLFWVNNACAQGLSWNETFGSYSNVTAQFNVHSETPVRSKVIDRTVISIYSDTVCGSLITSSTLNQDKSFQFMTGQSYSVNATSFYEACVTYLGNCGNGSIRSVKIQPRNSSGNIFQAPQPCFTVDATSGTKIVLTGAAADVAFVVS
jgi:hypothetical protein